MTSDAIYRAMRADTKTADDVAALLRLAAECMQDVAALSVTTWAGASEDAGDVARELQDLADRIETDYSTDEG